MCGGVWWASKAALVFLPDTLPSPSLIADLVPVDTCISAMVAVAWRTATRPGLPLTVYHCTSGSDRPITWGDMHRNFLDSVR